MIFKSSLLSQASGSLAGLVFQHGRGGLHIKSRSSPVNKQSAAQNRYRAAFSFLLSRWQTDFFKVGRPGLTMNDSVRAGWNNYAAHVYADISESGAKRLSGRDHFIRSNLPRLMYYQAAPVHNAAPQNLTLGVPPELAGINGFIDGNGNFQVNFTLTIKEPSSSFTNLSFLLFKATPACPPSVTRRRKAFAYFTTYGLLGFDPWPQQLSVTFTWPPWHDIPSRGPYDFCAAGCRIFISCQLSRLDSRLTSPQYFSLISPTHS
jgi:hypothetical protein